MWQLILLAMLGLITAAIYVREMRRSRLKPPEGVEFCLETKSEREHRMDAIREGVEDLKQLLATRQEQGDSSTS